MFAAFLRRHAPFFAPGVLAAVVALLLPSCEGVNFSILGYTTRPNYRCDICSVRVPIFKSQIYFDETRQGLEMQLTQAVIRQIELKTPWKVKEDADTELTGTIVSLNKSILNRNQKNLPRETETDLAVQVKWVDLRTGENLTKPARGPGALPPPPLPGTPLPPPGSPPPALDTVAVFSLGQLIPEIGQSNATAYKQNVDRMAVQIVSMMEEPWETPPRNP
jgi:hypothetical protein